MNKYWFVKVNGKWSKPYTFYPVAKYNSAKKEVEITKLILTI